MGQETCWTLVEAAGAGDAASRREFAERYLDAVRAYLGARWKGTPLAGEVEDAQQEVFVECLKAGGALERARRDARGGFRAYLYGVVRHVAARVEERRARAEDRPGAESFHPDGLPLDEESLSREFDRALARGLLRAALQLHARNARSLGGRAEARFELLRLRFGEGLAVADVAARQDADAAFLHHELATARAEFHACLREVVALHRPGATDGELERECRGLVELLER